jgi:hypothetical protein
MKMNFFMAVVLSCLESVECMGRSWATLDGPDSNVEALRLGNSQGDRFADPRGLLLAL